jgi:hypothetical protein
LPHNNYLLNTRDIKFVIKEWLDMKTLLSLDAYKEYGGYPLSSTYVIM